MEEKGNTSAFNPELNQSDMGAPVQIQNMLNATLNKTDAFTMRLNSTKNSIDLQNEEFKFKTRKSFYQKKNEKLWTLIDEYKAQKQVQAESQLKHEQATMVQRFKDQIKDQMKETDIKKNNQKAVVQIERSEIQKKMEIYRKEEEKEKQAADEKRIKIFEMMQQNIQNHKIN